MPTTWGSERLALAMNKRSERSETRLGKAIRSLIGAIYKDLGSSYEGQYEKEIQEIEDALIERKEKEEYEFTHKMRSTGKNILDGII